jgi:ActR/RegA family two-component response regulator
MPLTGNYELSMLRTNDRLLFARRIKDAVRSAGGNLSEAARMLGITKRTLSRWLAQDTKLSASVRAIKEAMKP